MASDGDAMTVTKDLSGMNESYSRAQQIHSVPKPALRDVGKAGYAEATARATNAQGRLVCEDCGRPVPKGREERHHIKKRSALGGNEAANILVTGKPCHDWRESHGGKRMPKAQRDKLTGNCVYK